MLSLQFALCSDVCDNCNSKYIALESDVLLLVVREGSSSVETSYSGKLPESVIDDLSMSRNLTSTSVCVVILFSNV